MWSCLLLADKGVQVLLDGWGQRLIAHAVLKHIIGEIRGAPTAHAGGIEVLVGGGLLLLLVLLNLQKPLLQAGIFLAEGRVHLPYPLHVLRTVVLQQFFHIHA